MKTDFCYIIMLSNLKVKSPSKLETVKWWRMGKMNNNWAANLLKFPENPIEFRIQKR